MRILGIDPGSAVTGFGVVERVGSRAEGGGNEIQHLAHGTLRPPARLAAAERLAALYADLADLISRHQPDAAVVERVFVAASPKSALVLGQARGVALAAIAARGIPVWEYSPSQIKQAVVGTGSASKAQVQAMAKRLLSLERLPAPDAADALAAAICHLHSSRLAALGVVARSRPRKRRADARPVVRRLP